MFEMFNLCLDMQKKMIDAHQRQVEATEQALEAWKHGANAAGAQADAWRKWLALWGVRG